MQTPWTRSTRHSIDVMHHMHHISYFDCMRIQCVTDVGVGMGEDFGTRQGDGVW